MSQFYDAFDISPVPTPGPDAVPPEPFRGIYGMPAFVRIASADLAASIEFWTRGLGFFELFTVPDQVVHLRRWAFQDVLLVPTTAPTAHPGALSVNFACVLSELDGIANACRALDASSVGMPHDTFWNTRDVEVTTPEGVRVVFTAAKPYVASSAEARNLEAMGITAPAPRRGGDTAHG